ncbi:MAG TPA: heavy metal translocating P-type ATPase [Burkholderiales bacterium]|nr:heavy metal translocating P-type ATPase [Burkholderiales bacterium]
MLAAPSAVAATCFHCGLPLGPGELRPLHIAGEPRFFCCAGCEAVSTAIAGAGLEAYYRLRDATAGRPAADAHDREGYAAYDDPAFQANFVVSGADGTREAALLLDGVRCSACVWLNEQVIQRLPGVAAVSINYATRRAQVRWDPERLALSEILAAVGRIGYRAFPYDRARADAVYQSERRTALWRLFVAGFGMMQVMMYAAPTYIAGDEGGMPPDVEALMRWASLALTVPVVGYSARPFLLGAWRDFKARRAGMDVPVALGILVAFVASVWATLRGSGEVYFDSVTMFVFLLLAGRYLEFEARHRAGAALAHLGRLVPAQAERLREFPGPVETERVAVAALRPGDFVLVRPGERVPADGTVAQGEGALNESLLTGESRAVAKRPGSRVIGGSISISAPFVVRVERVGEDTVLAAIGRLVERAMTERHRLVELADRYAHWFVLGVLLIAAVVAAAWALMAPDRALWIAVAVLVVTCPCALSLATPVALTVATGELARRGLVVTRGHAVEALARATDVVFDKTGTLTYGELRVAAVRALGAIPLERCEALAQAIESSSEHPIGRALLRHAGAGQVAVEGAVTSDPGRGIAGTVEGVRYRLGGRAYCAEVAGPPNDAHDAVDTSATVVYLAAEGAWLARFELADTLKPGATALVRRLEAMGKRVHLLSGDGAGAVHAAAAALGIHAVRAEAEPAAKQAYVNALQKSGAIVAMVGDGVNDAPVLAQANVSVALGTGAELTQTGADAVLLSGDPSALVEAFDLARRAMNVIRQNLAWAAVYNLVAVPAAAAGLVTPWMAGIGMSGSSLAVVLNALRLRRGSGTAVPG